MRESVCMCMRVCVCAVVIIIMAIFNSVYECAMDVLI